ncbi:TPA: hypothetical protein ACX6RV_000897 [Photobacterium damselae]
MTNKRIINKLTDSEVLWRYMDLAKFLSLLSSNSIWLARTDTFKDKREGMFHDAMKAELDEIYSQLETDGKLNSNDEIKNTSDFQRYLSDNTYISCWHKNSSENMVMWEIYGHTENSIAIKTTAERLVRSFNLDEVYNIATEFALDEVKYIEHNSATSERNYRQPFFIKRHHFKFEQEARLYLLVKERKYRGDAPLGHNLKINIKDLIESVYVHPDSEEWFLSAVKDLVLKYNLSISVNRGSFGNT